MPKPKLYWDPAGVELDSLGEKKFVRITDGDTPYISMSIRMLSIDTPETHYPGRENPSNHDQKFKDLSEWIHAGKAPIKDRLGEYLHPKLATGNAGTLQKQQGDKATEEFQKLLDERLKKPSGKKRNLFLRTSSEPFDMYGRLLAYIAPSYSGKELETVTFEDRKTFNLLMVESGWAALFPIYPSLPKYNDLSIAQKAAAEAFIGSKGAWEDPLSLTGYEFRMCHKLWKVTNKIVGGKKVSWRDKQGWIARYCVDMATRDVYEPQDYYKVKPYNRVFIWPEDVNDAIGNLNLEPAF